jgi:hypothetical protein
VYPSSFEPTGRQMVVVRNGDIVVVTIENGQARSSPLFETPEEESEPDISPDGHWLAYTSRVSGRQEVYVRPFPGPGAPVPVSVDGGSNAAWNPAGGELFFSGLNDPTGKSNMMAVDFAPGLRPRVGRPNVLFPFVNTDIAFRCIPVRCYDTARDGQRFYTIQTRMPAGSTGVTHINYIPNWFQELKAKVPVRR